MNSKLKILLGATLCLTSLWGCSYLYGNAPEGGWVLFPAYVTGMIGMMAGAGMVADGLSEIC